MVTTDNTDVQHRSLPPVVYRNTRVLILGSLPGSASLAAQAYYAHPRNHFWRIFGVLLDEPDLAERSYAQRLRIFKHHRIGLWDVVGQAQRQGSLDQNLKNITPNPLAELLPQLPQLNAIAFNGQTAARIGQRQLSDNPLLKNITFYTVPSTSPANTMPFAEKVAAWKMLIKR
ncbi:MAG: DNA-deoxyinosine glycosylase [Proteobacteria bacterium]|nr:DNA-deoxyinosine glycosylase [Pseudomonadota bacterium]MCL2307501.1 DNA-deoxyinosine glycosylase [Pseudomonadota bacterium]